MTETNRQTRLKLPTHTCDHKDPARHSLSCVKSRAGVFFDTGRKLETLADCRAYILELPQREHASWEGVVAELLKAAEHGGPFRFIARVAFSRALLGWQASSRQGRDGISMPHGRRSEPEGNGDDYCVDIHRHEQADRRSHQLLIFSDQDSANAWFKEFDPEGVAFEYPVIGKEAGN
jgi:hypothetical protein